MGRGGRARQQPHEDRSPVDRPIGAQTKSRLTISSQVTSFVAARYPPYYLATDPPPLWGRLVKPRRKSASKCPANASIRRQFTRFYWGNGMPQYKRRCFATETRLALYPGARHHRLP